MKHGHFEPLHPLLEYRAGTFTLREPLSYFDRKGKRHTARPGLQSDGASIPLSVMPIAGHPWAKSNALPALIHDQETHDSRLIGGAAGYRMRIEADRLFPEMVRACTHNPITPYLKLAGVTLGRWRDRARGQYREHRAPPWPIVKP